MAIIELLKILQNKHLKRILQSTDHEKELIRIEKEICKELNGRDEKIYRDKDLDNEF